jgi:DNA-binding MarR family transcriptional regulator
VDASLPGLLRGAWSTYGKAVHSAMVEGGFDDMPRSGAYVVGAVARAGLPLSRIVAQLGFSKQAAGQLVDTLVVRGYLERAADPTDRRRLTVSLTPRGEAAAAVAREAIAAVDQTLTDRLGAGEVLDLRRALAAVMESGATAADS